VAPYTLVPVIRAGTWFAFRSAGGGCRETVKRIYPFLFGTGWLHSPQVNLLPDLNKSNLSRLIPLQFYHSSSMGIKSSEIWVVLFLWFKWSIFSSFHWLPYYIFLHFKRKGRAFTLKLSVGMEKTWSNLATEALPMAAIGGALRPRWPGFRISVTRLDIFIPLYFIYLLSSDARFGQAIDRHLKNPFWSYVVTSMLVLFWLVGD